LSSLSIEISLSFSLVRAKVTIGEAGKERKRERRGERKRERDNERGRDRE